jgi:HEPN domain-containing protein
VNRSDFQHLARIRIKEAKALLDNGCYDGAYYLAGYAVECALKACIAKQTQRHDFPNKKQAEESYTHDLTKLIKVAKLENALNDEIALDRTFAKHWITVRDWSEAARYKTVTQESAEKLYKPYLFYKMKFY